jgi:hypothetical protein
MKSILFLLITLSILSSCTKTDKTRFNETCIDSCTIIQGRFITGNNEGIANVPIEIKSETHPTLGLGQTHIRYIASGKTDNDGYYSLSFSLQNKEYGPGQSASVYMYFNYKRSKFLPISQYEYFGFRESLATALLRKDTTIKANIYLPSKSKIKIRLENFIPVQAYDNFSVFTTCGVGLERFRTAGELLEASQVLTEKDLDACGNEQTMIYIRKRKNGIATVTIDTVLVPTGQTINRTYVY